MITVFSPSSNNPLKRTLEVPSRAKSQTTTLEVPSRATQELSCTPLSVQTLSVLTFSRLTLNTETGLPLQALAELSNNKPDTNPFDSQTSLTICPKMTKRAKTLAKTDLHLSRMFKDSFDFIQKRSVLVDLHTELCKAELTLNSDRFMRL